jgi:hypothetical protein
MNLTIISIPIPLLNPSPSVCMSRSIYRFFFYLRYDRPTQSLGYVYRAAASALNIEHGRLQKLKELCEGNQVMRSSSKQVLLKTDIGHLCLKALNL